ncbi:unnamed protein product, partial [Prorocentrum cordatum]
PQVHGAHGLELVQPGAVPQGVALRVLRHVRCLGGLPRGPQVALRRVLRGHMRQLPLGVRAHVRRRGGASGCWGCGTQAAQHRHRGAERRRPPPPQASSDVWGGEGAGPLDPGAQRGREAPPEAGAQRPQRGRGARAGPVDPRAQCGGEAPLDAAARRPRRG